MTQMFPLWRDTAATALTQPKFQAEIDAAVQQLATTQDVQLILALQAKISVLETQQRKQMPAVNSDFKSPLGNKLPEKLVDSYDFTKSSITVVEHLEKLGDFLLLRKDKQYFIHFLVQTLTGDTLRLFREQLREHPDMSYEDACNWLKLNCIHRGERDQLNKQLQAVKQLKGERVQTFLLRARALRQKLAALDV